MRYNIRIDEMIRLEELANKNDCPIINADVESHLRICLEYLNLANSMPYDEIVAAIKNYDNSTPKMDELLFVKNLAEKYKQSQENVIKRIQYVRRLEKHRRKG